MVLEPGWLARQAMERDEDVERWPDWMKRAAGLPVCEHEWRHLQAVEVAGHVRDVWICLRCAACEARR